MKLSTEQTTSRKEITPKNEIRRRLSANRFTNIGDVNFALFNCHDEDLKKGYGELNSTYGQESIDYVKTYIKNHGGIMSLFGHKPTREIILFVEVVSVSVEKRIAAKSNNSQEAKTK